MEIFRGKVKGGKSGRGGRAGPLASGERKKRGRNHFLKSQGRGRRRPSLRFLPSIWDEKGKRKKTTKPSAKVLGGGRGEREQRTLWRGLRRKKRRGFFLGVICWEVTKRREKRKIETATGSSSERKKEEEGLRLARLKFWGKRERGKKKGGSLRLLWQGK